MPVCPCGERLVRIPRRFWQRFRYSAVYRCPECGPVATKRAAARLFSRDSLCPRCGTTRLRILSRRDPVDTMAASFASWLQKKLGGKLHYCSFCRLQFYDLRNVAGGRSSAHPGITP